VEQSTIVETPDWFRLPLAGGTLTPNNKTMKKLLALALLLCQCAAPTAEIRPTSIDVEDFNEQIVELPGLPFDIVVPDDWEVTDEGFEHQLWKTNSLQMAFSYRAEILEIPEGANVIEAENPDITTFCLDEYCIVQVQEGGLYHVDAYTDEAFQALTRLR
jgi:hypothetical protein